MWKNAMGGYSNRPSQAFEYAWNRATFWAAKRSSYIGGGIKIISPVKTVMKGVIHGRIIELESEPGLPEGQAITVLVQPVVPKNSQAALEALKRAAGAWENDDPEGLEQYLEQTRQRKVCRPEIADTRGEDDDSHT